GRGEITGDAGDQSSTAHRYEHGVHARGLAAQLDRDRPLSADDLRVVVWRDVYTSRFAGVAPRDDLDGSRVIVEEMQMRTTELEASDLHGRCAARKEDLAGDAEDRECVHGGERVVAGGGRDHAACPFAA